MSGEQAAGSLWNKNSWHWEEKDYNKWTKQRLIEIISGIELSYGDKPVILKDINPTGFASISVRKGKKIVSYEFELSCGWECGESSGRIAIPEISQEESKPILRVSLASGDDLCKEYIRNSSSIWHTALQNLSEELKQAEGSTQSLEEDKARRTDELAKTVKAEAEKGEEKLKMYQEIKATEAAPVNDASASVWNVNAYHWETRKVLKPTVAWLKDNLENHFSNLKVEGEAEVSIRKGKKIVVFDLNIECDEFRVDNFNQEDAPKIQWISGEDRKDLVVKILSGLEGHLRATN